MGYLQGLKVPPYKVLINYKGEKSNFTAKKPGRHHLHQGIKVNITVMGQIRIMHYLLRCNKNTASLLWILLPKMHVPNLTLGKHQTYPN